jgi:hypothetical protein
VADHTDEAKQQIPRCRLAARAALRSAVWALQVKLTLDNFPDRQVEVETIRADSVALESFFQAGLPVDQHGQK